MSFDIFLQAFRQGDAARGDGTAAMAVLAPLVAERGDQGWALIRTEDGTADVHGLDDADGGLMFTHVDGRDAWNVIYAVAAAAGFVVMPAGCGTLLTDQAMRERLPEGVPEPVLAVGSGADMLAIIESIL